MISPEAILKNPEIISALIGEVKPVLRAVGQEIKGLVQEFATEKEFQVACAQITHNKYEAYLEVGFSKEEALALIMRDHAALEKALSNATSGKKTSTK